MKKIVLILVLFAFKTTFGQDINYVTNKGLIVTGKKYDSAAVRTLINGISGGTDTVEKIGLWVNNSFTGVVQPSDITGVTGAATFVFNNNVTISGGNQDLGNNHLRSTKTSFSNNATLSYSFTINTKPATANDGIWFGKVSAFGNNYTCYVKLERTHADSFKLVLFNRNGVSLITRMDSSINSIFMANGADYEMDINIGFQTIGATIKRVVAGKYVARADILYRQPSRFPYGIPNMGAVGFGVLGGSYTVKNIKEFEHDIKGADVVIVGTSISQGYHATSLQTHWIDRIFSNSKKTYINYGQGANTFVPVVLNLPQIWNTQAKLLLLEIGVNDAALNMRSYYNQIIDSANARNMPIVILKDFQDPARDSIIYNVTSERGVRLIDVGKILTAQFLTDGIHPSDKGNELIAEACVKQYPDVFGTTTSNLSPALESLRDVNINYATLAEGNFITYDTAQKKFINKAPTTFINNSDGIAVQTANFRVSGFGVVGSGFAIGSATEGGFPLKLSGTSSNDISFKMENLNTASSSGFKYGSMSMYGTSAYGITDWQNALVTNSYGNGGIVQHSYSSGFKWNVNNSTNRMSLTNAGNLGIGTTTPTANLHVLQATPTSVVTTSVTATASPTTIIGGNGGATSSNGATVNAGNAGHIILTGGNGGAITGTPTVGVGGAGGNITPTAGDGGAGTTQGGNGGNFEAQGGNSGFGTAIGVAGYSAIKGGNAFPSGNGNGGNVFLTAGAKNGSGQDGSIFLGLSPSLVARGNTVIGSATDDYINKLQVTGRGKFTDTLFASKIKGDSLFFIGGTYPSNIVYNSASDQIDFNSNSFLFNANHPGGDFILTTAGGLAQYVNAGAQVSFGSYVPAVGAKVHVEGNLNVTGTIKDAGIVLNRQGADVASVAGAMTLGTDGTSFEITGTNAITLLSNIGRVNGNEVTLMFTSTATLVNGTVTSGTNVQMLLAGGANFSATADDTITLILGEIAGTQVWREKCRSVN
jgi:hypothetical protein